MESFFQTDAWGAFKEKPGWLPKRYDGLLGLWRQLPLGQSILYFPELPVDGKTATRLKKVIADLPPNGQTFARFEFLGEWQPALAAALLKLGLKKSFEEVQPEHRQWVDVGPSEEKILEQMKPKGRYNIRLAEKHNLKIERGTSPELVRRFSKLYANTAQNQKFAGRDEDYFQDLVKVLKAEGAGEVMVVKKGSEDLAAGVFLYFGGINSYLYGGSGGDRSLMAPYLLHWEAIKTAKKKGLAIYDLLAIAPPDQPNHPYANLTRFKSQFGGRSVRLLGSWDLVSRPFWYRLYQLAETRRRGNL
ncbi:MAG TPA: peptidoglycan bridge formation glycyltransferase FemA/FemB family protein [Candidatus Saccharimonadales bacterium]|nr:peptidoglycan bridge formation glycyltransferase FemA/FemB family protein [Candidatus Saccharimonadales bacterium]